METASLIEAATSSEAAARSRLSLAESIEAALENNVRVRQADREAEHVRLQLEPARAANLMQPDPVRLL